MITAAVVFGVSLANLVAYARGRNRLFLTASAAGFPTGVLLPAVWALSPK